MYRVEVIADNSGKWVGNYRFFETVEEAEVYARDLAWRWTLVRQWRVVPAQGLADGEKALVQGVA